MSVLAIPTASVFEPLLQPSKRYRGAWGGRGSGKSHFFAEACVERCVIQPGTRIVCVREVQRSLNESAKRLIEDKIEALAVPGFRILNDRTETPGGGVIVYQGMRDHSAETIKSFEGFDVAWVEEASSLSARSLQLLRPTIRKPGSELWFSWNPRRKSDAVDMLLRGDSRPEQAVVIRANWSDNPWFPAELEAERRHDLKHSPSYQHIWEGDYATVVEGAYYAQALSNAKAEQRITDVYYDPMLELRAFWDLGVEDAMAIWVAQFAGNRINVLDYVEGVGQPLGFYAQWLRGRGYADALCILPHDAARRGMGDAISFEQHLKDAGFRTRIIANQGKGAAMLRVEAARRLFPRIWFDAGKCAPGLEALGAYHERRDEHRNVGLGPEHDWSSHGADAFGLMCVAFDPPKVRTADAPSVWTHEPGEEATAWMGS